MARRQFNEEPEEEVEVPESKPQGFDHSIFNLPPE